MLDVNVGILVRDAINREVAANAVTLEDVCKMQPIAKVSGKNCYNVLGIQWEDTTILVIIQFTEKQDVRVIGVKTCDW